MPIYFYLPGEAYGALSNFSRVPSPEPPNVSTCCCGREDCESSRAWATCKAKLESRLVLSAGTYQRCFGGQMAVAHGEFALQRSARHCSIWLTIASASTFDRP